MADPVTTSGAIYAASQIIPAVTDLFRKSPGQTPSLPSFVPPQNMPLPPVASPARLAASPRQSAPYSTIAELMGGKGAVPIAPSGGAQQMALLDLLRRS